MSVGPWERPRDTLRYYRPIVIMVTTWKTLQRNLRLNSKCLLKSIQARELHGLMDLRRLLLAPSRSKLRRFRVQEIPGIRKYFGASVRIRTN